jgi:hypothetical protein
MFFWIDTDVRQDFLDIVTPTEDEAQVLDARTGDLLAAYKVQEDFLYREKSRWKLSDLPGMEDVNKRAGS